MHLWGHDFRVLRKWQSEHPLRAYLRVVIARLVWERLGHFQPALEQLEDGPLMSAAARHDHLAMPPTPEQLVCARELLGMVHRAIEGLNANDRYILELRYVKELSYREIACVLGITLTNAGVRLARAHGRLKEVLHQHIDELEIFGLEELSFACQPTTGL